MAVVDAERVLAELKAYFLSRQSFGQRQLLEEVARLEGQCVLDEDEHQKHLRRFAVELDEAFRNAASLSGATGPLPDARQGDGDGTGRSTIERATAPEGGPHACPSTRTRAPALTTTT